MGKAIIYKITSPSKKVYIGQTIDTFNTRMRGHRKKGSNCLLLKRAINKYGWKNMHKEILIEIDDYEQDLLDFWEQEMIKVFNSQAPAGYNCDSGGQSGGVRNELTKQKIRDTCARKLKESEYMGMITNRRGGFRLRWGNRWLGTYNTNEAAMNAAIHFKKTGEKLPGRPRMNYTT